MFVSLHLCEAASLKTTLHMREHAYFGQRTALTGTCMCFPLVAAG